MHALRVLEYDSVRSRLASRCETILGKGLADEISPLFDPEAVWISLEATAEAHDALARHSPPSLSPVKDLRLAFRRAKKGGVLGGQELYQAGTAFSAMRQMRDFLRPQAVSMPRLAPYGDALPDLRAVEERLLESLESDGSLRDDASPALSSLRVRKRGAAARIQERIQSYVSGPSRILLSDPIFTVRDGRYVLPLKVENRGKIRGIVHDTSASGQTVYVEPEDVLQLGNALREVEGLERAEELRILASLSARVGTVADEATGGLEAAAQIDLIFAKGRLAYDDKGTLPERVQGDGFLLIDRGRHPLLDPAMAVPLDLEVGVGRSVLITGPNTGGKTVGIKTAGLFVAMAQSGMFPPALRVRLAPFSQLWADIGDEQSLEQSLSTFSGHIKNIASALKKLQPGALVLLDEVGAGTDPAEGAALAVAILRELRDKGAAVLASTHYGELKAFAFDEEGYQNAAMEFDPKTLRPTYRLRMGAPGASQALRIAERYGIPESVVEVARENLGRQAQDIAKMMEELDRATRLARQAQSDADRRSTELKKAEDRAKRKLEEADEIRRTAHSKANEVIEAALREIRLEAARLFDELRAAPKEGDRVRGGLRDLDAAGRDLAAQFAPKTRPTAAREWKKGDRAKVGGYSQVATLMDDPKGGKVVVQAGVVRMTVPLNTLEAVSEPAPMRPRSSVTSMRLKKATTAVTEFLILGKRAEEAERELENFLDQSVLSGMDSVRIVHGKGEGILRRMTQDLLSRHPGIGAFREGDATEGGAGVTIATFK
ncbi:endonuclease MutS2 [soil metagenome]